MNQEQKRAFVQKARRKFAKGGAVVKRKHFASGGPSVSTVLGSVGSGAATGAALGTIVPGIGNLVGGAIGAIGGLIAGLFSGSAPQMPNIVDPVTGQQITDANGTVVASQQQLQQFASTLQGSGGPQAQQAAIQGLAQVYTGSGPNPAQAMLAEATGQNVASTQAAMAGQRGAASNVGLIARESAQQGANTEQQAVGQNTTIQSNQQLNALNALGTQGANLTNATNTALTNAGQLAATNQGQVLTAQSQYNTNLTSGQGNVNSSNASILGTALPLVAGAANGVLSGAGAATVANNSPGTGTAGTTQSQAAQQQAAGTGRGAAVYASGGRVHPGPHKSHVANYLTLFKGGQAKEVPAMVSPGEIYLSPDHVKAVQHGANPLKLSRRIPGKAKVKGDSLKNDTVPATLEEGGVVLPRHIVNSMSPDKAKLFVLKSISKRGGHGQ